MYNSLIFNILLFQRENTGLQSEGKIYVVITAIILLFVGLGAYLFWLERKLKRVEQRIKDEETTHKNS